VACSSCSGDFAELLQGSVDSVHHLLRTVVAAASTSAAGSQILLQTLHRVFCLVVHSHAFVSEFFSTQWELLFAMKDARFEQWSVHVLVMVLQESGPIEEAGNGSLTSTASHTSEKLKRSPWTINPAQAKLIELLVHMLPQLSRENQVSGGKDHS
jgi:hypothetical protein